jgi:hypothetical protein
MIETGAGTPAPGHSLPRARRSQVTAIVRKEHDLLDHNQIRIHLQNPIEYQSGARMRKRSDILRKV